MSYSRPARPIDANSGNPPKHTSARAPAPVPAQRIAADVPATVSALLAQTRRLESSLQQWSALEVSENEVSDVFVAVGNTFHEMLAAFAAWHIDMSNVASFLPELRRVLEDCLSEEPTPMNINYLVPQVRAIIAALLIGLKDRKDAYWRAVQARGGAAAGGR